MTLTKIAPKISSDNFKHTKIIATIGPATNSYKSILELLKAGANGIRLNFSHGTYDERRQQIKWIRKASLELSKPVAIIQDLQGPKIRLGDFDGVVPVQKGQTLKLKYGANFERDGILPIQYDLSKMVKRGEKIYLFDGRIQAIIKANKDGVIYAQVENEGILIARKGINLPDTDFGGDIITKKDRQDLAFASENDFDYIALSFVQTAEDILYLRKLLKNLNCDAKIIAKIETKVATKNLTEIAKQADVLMAARGDLAIEARLEDVPIIQRRIVNLGLCYARPTIIATQMLASMTDNPEPTRAEVSDVATAVFTGADAVMLSDETANGKYPIESVSLMKRIIKSAQAEINEFEVINPQKDTTVSSPQDAIPVAVISLAKSINATAIVAETKTGATALKIAACRPRLPLIVVTSSKRVAQQLALLYGAITFIREDEQYQATKLTNWLKQNQVLKADNIIVTASGQFPGVIGKTDTIRILSL